MEWKNKTFLIKIIPALVAALLIGGSVLTFAMIDETNSVHIDAGEIEDSTLIIGSHLIYIGSMKDQIYQIAMDSAAEATQHKRYYKSELAGGVWYDITDAGTLADITTAGVVVPDREIEALYITHHTKSDGITYDLRTNKAVCVFDIKNPYDLEHMEEMEAIKRQYDSMAQLAEPSKTNERDMLLIEEIFDKERHTEKTDELDAALYGLQGYYEVLTRDGAEEENSAMVMHVMEKIDASRRTEVLQLLNDTELQKFAQVASREYTYVKGEVTGEVKVEDLIGEKAAQMAKAAGEQAMLGIEDPEEAKAAADEAREAAIEEVMAAGRDTLDVFAFNTDLASAIGEAISNVQDSYTNYMANMLTEGTAVLSRTEYLLCMELIDLAKIGNYAGCDDVVQKLIYLDRINHNTIREEDAERDFIEAELLLQSENAYRISLFAGEGEAYQSLSSMAAAATRANVLKQQKTETEIKRNEMQFILKAYLDRMPIESAKEYIANCIENIDLFRSGIKADAYETYAHASADAYLEWLRQTMKDLEENAGGKTMDSLLEKKQNLQEERMTALDNNQLGLAKKLEAQIEALDRELRDLQDRLNAILNSGSTSASEKARAAAQLGKGSAAANLEKMKSDALRAIQEDNLDAAAVSISGVSAMADVLPQNTLKALQDIYNDLSNEKLMEGNAGNTDALLRQIEAEAAEQMENFIEDLSENDMLALMDAFMEDVMGSLAAERNGSLLEDADAGTGSEQSMADSLSGVIRGASERELAVILSGLGMYAEQTKSPLARAMLADYANYAAASGNAYLFRQLLAEPGAVYAPTDGIAKICKYRYIFNDSQKAVTLQQGSLYYKFKAFSEIAEKGGVLEDMPVPAGFQGVIYIQKDAAKAYFDIETENLYDTKYGVLLTPEMKEQAIEFFDYLLEAGGEF